MDAAFWIDTWAQGRIGFHQGHPHDYLVRFAERLAPAQRLLVPLCGKSADLAYLAGRGHHVTGVELVEDAVRAFFVEHEVTPTVEARGPFTAYSAGAITILTGDMFATTTELLGRVDGFYDRAALIALPPPLRTRYVAHLRALLAPAWRGLVVTLEYPQAQLEGPPFSVHADELRQLYQGADVELLDDQPAVGGRAETVGARERCFQLVDGTPR